MPNGSLLKSKGLRISLVGALVVAVCMPALLVVPQLIPGLAMMLGGLAVIGGFVWTLAEVYFPPTEGPPDA